MDDDARLAAKALRRANPTSWFEDLYAEADTGDAVVPWDTDEPSPLVGDWVRQADAGEGRAAVVVGCGYGRDAEVLAERGWSTTAFDIAPSAVAAARRRHAGSGVSYVEANLLDLPADWVGAFDLVAESLTVQSLPLEMRDQAVAAVRSLVRPGGRLLVVAVARTGEPDDAFVAEGPPWPLDRAEIDSFALDPTMMIESLELVRDRVAPDMSRWRAVFRRTEAH